MAAATDDDHLLHCVVCDSDMTEIFHYPVVSPCECNTRICQACRQRLRSCPTCRASLGEDEGVDAAFLERITLLVKGKTCDGCKRFVRSRHTVKHARECPALLTLRLQETMDDALEKEREYRKAVQENDRLRLRMCDMNYQLSYLSRYYARTLRQQPPPPPHTGSPGTPPATFIPLPESPSPPPPPLVGYDYDSDTDVEMEVVETHYLPPATQV